MKRVALFVGVNRYKDPSVQPLKFAERDATELYGFFKHRTGYDYVDYLLSPDSESILGRVEHITSNLGPGDLFLFFFAGHGVEFNGKHLLLTPGALLRRLKHSQQVVPVDLLKDETRRSGVSRVLVFDACRLDPLRTRGLGGGDGIKGTRALRDIVLSGEDDGQAGPMAILCACDESQPSHTSWPNVAMGCSVSHSSENWRKPSSRLKTCFWMAVCRTGYAHACSAWPTSILFPQGRSPGFSVAVSYRRCCQCALCPPTHS